MLLELGVSGPGIEWPNDAINDHKIYEYEQKLHFLACQENKIYIAMNTIFEIVHSTNIYVFTDAKNADIMNQDHLGYSIR